MAMQAMKRAFTASTAAALLAACGQAPDAPDPSGDPAAGKAFIETHCTACHSVEGESLAPGIPHLAGQVEAYLVQSMEAYRDGTRFHAALHELTAEMSDQRIRDVAAWFAGRPPAPPSGTAEATPTSYELGAEISERCATCHGENGNSTTPGMPSLAGQQPLYLIAATQAYLTGRRGDGAKAKMLDGLDSIDIERMALFYASQHPVPRPAPDFGDPAKGEALSASCSGCHGLRGVSRDPATPSLAGQDPTYLVQAITAYRDHERHDDVMLAERTPQDIEDIAAYYAAQTPVAADDEPASARLLAEKCDRCHAPATPNPALVVPHIAGQDRDYLIMVMRAYRDDRRPNSAMHSMSSPYSDAMIEGVATIYANRAPE